MMRCSHSPIQMGLVTSRCRVVFRITSDVGGNGPAFSPALVHDPYCVTVYGRLHSSRCSFGTSDKLGVAAGVRQKLTRCSCCCRTLALSKQKGCTGTGVQLAGVTEKLNGVTDGAPEKGRRGHTLPIQNAH